ncbi:hypothetical protein AUEXF2481DRAFT_42976 [Aureobasidium subglaciale EXF-2481]|uniref:F-box domain-containing protein n=1 Tax=Aureobasidium subglaciale (strain EXF-2481) TaxID=1043005 RepID=A0A074Y410_AURSE|nr:uncharacterized protein AUEXF2481DRAFT_42976 [Aureobasidium subglaciale EXF-2481]KAI5210814.1 hypothetical protein E4T38_01748 [Aureobasidium subglaciale]KAI5229420.1 hypothetical protein E4T40_01732 [Aureobasidium subglaciale]KAI5232856.1 hypothetical protein E4T41_01746 [Aureobasidium subglaciale]KAI5266293.1 hypothetical protein E4T46_01729 [Aureobasidium subglaciale]KEQ92533.1 hypothetical protein AUEXF2481DRAFT_42976 [Aureobasidium subglaciale EXF-2481]
MAKRSVKRVKRAPTPSQEPPTQVQAGSKFSDLPNQLLLEILSYLLNGEMKLFRLINKQSRECASDRLGEYFKEYTCPFDEVHLQRLVDVTSQASLAPYVGTPIIASIIQNHFSCGRRGPRHLPTTERCYAKLGQALKNIATVRVGLFIGFEILIYPYGCCTPINIDTNNVPDSLKDRLFRYTLKTGMNIDGVVVKLPLAASTWYSHRPSIQAHLMRFLAHAHIDNFQNSYNITIEFSNYGMSTRQSCVIIDHSRKTLCASNQSGDNCVLLRPLLLELRLDELALYGCSLTMEQVASLNGQKCLKKVVLDNTLAGPINRFSRYFRRGEPSASWSIMLEELFMQPEELETCHLINFTRRPEDIWLQGSSETIKEEVRSYLLASSR